MTNDMIEAAGKAAFHTHITIFYSNENDTLTHETHSCEEIGCFSSWEELSIEMRKSWMEISYAAYKAAEFSRMELKD